MSSFELVNHQLKHLFGGIQAETNSSIDYLENDQKKIAKSMQRAKANHLKIYEAVSTIKNSLSDLSENCFSLSKETKQSGSILWRLSNQINHVLQDISEESLSLSKKMAAKMEYYLPGLKKAKEKYTQYAQNLQHYRQKLILLKKSIQKQPPSSSLPEDKERYQRNIQKFRKAQRQYDQILIKTTTKLVGFNNEGMKDICYDLVSIFSTFSSNIIQSGHRMTCFLQQVPQLSRVKQQTQAKGKKTLNGEKASKLDSLHQSSLHSKQIKDQRDFLQKLIIQKQISNYLKDLIDKDLAKIENKKIKEQFVKSNANHIHKEGEKTVQFFNNFQNQYNNSSLQHHKNNLLQKMKEQDPLQACVDLLDIAKPIQPFKRMKEPDHKSKQKIQLQRPLENSQEEEKIKKNLDKFNKICEQNPILKQKNMQKLKNEVKDSQKNNQSIKSPRTLKTKEQFFSLSLFEKNETKQQNQRDPQQQLTKLHEHPFDFKIFQKPAQNTLKQPLPSLSQKHIPKVGDSPNLRPAAPIVNFDNFDFMMKDHQTEKRTQSNLSIQATPNISANFKQKKSSANFEDFDLLSL